LLETLIKAKPASAKGQICKRDCNLFNNGARYKGRSSKGTDRAIKKDIILVKEAGSLCINPAEIGYWIDRPEFRRKS